MSAALGLRTSGRQLSEMLTKAGVRQKTEGAEKLDFLVWLGDQVKASIEEKRRMNLTLDELSDFLRREELENFQFDAKGVVNGLLALRRRELARRCYDGTTIKQLQLTDECFELALLDMPLLDVVSCFGSPLKDAKKAPSSTCKYLDASNDLQSVSKDPALEIIVKNRAETFSTVLAFPDGPGKGRGIQIPNGTKLRVASGCAEQHKGATYLKVEYEHKCYYMNEANTQKSATHIKKVPDNAQAAPTADAEPNKQTTNAFFIGDCSTDEEAAEEAFFAAAFTSPSGAAKQRRAREAAEAAQRAEEQCFDAAAQSGKQTFLKSETPQTSQESRRGPFLPEQGTIKLPALGEVVTVTADDDALFAAAKKAGLQGSSAILGSTGKITKIDLKDGTVQIADDWWVAIAALQGYEARSARPAAGTWSREPATADGNRVAHWSLR